MSLFNQTLTISKTGTIIFMDLEIWDTAYYPKTVESLVTGTY
jgi:hypothetical protein